MIRSAERLVPDYVMPAVLCLVAVSVAVGFVLHMRWSPLPDIRAHERRLRTAGEPVTPQELAATYVAATPDPTAAWVEAGRHFAARQEADANGPYAVLFDPPADAPRPSDIDRPHLEFAERWLADNAGGFAAAERAAAIGGPARFGTDLTRGHAADLTDTVNLRRIEPALRLRALVAARRGDAAAALADVHRLLALAEAPSREPILLSQLVRHVFFTSATRTLDEILSLVEPTSGQLAALQARLAATDFRAASRRALAGDRVSTRLAFVEGLPDPADPTPGWFEALWWLTGPHETVRLYRLHEQAAAAAGLPPPRDRRELATLVSAAGRAEWHGLRRLGNILVPSLDRFHLAMLRAEVRRDAMVVRLACERYRLAEGRWPQSAAALMPRFLTRVPTDPYDGQPLRFRSGDDGVVVYSVFENGTDDGGEDILVEGRVPADLGWRTSEMSARPRADPEPDPQR